MMSKSKQVLGSETGEDGSSFHMGIANHLRPQMDEDRMIFMTHKYCNCFSWVVSRQLQNYFLLGAFPSQNALPASA